MMFKRTLRMGAYAAKLAMRRPKGWKSVLFNTAMAKAKISGPLMLPAHVSIEPTNACNARCPVCETGNGTLGRRTGLMEFDKYCRLIDQIAPHTSVLMFYFMGEPFLHKDSYEMIRYARSKDIYVETCTNGDFVDAKGVIYSDINQISFQIGGMTQETHEVYRVRSNLERIKSNVTALVEERKKHPSSNVQIEIGFIVMKHNEHEVPKFVEWAKAIGADKANIIDPCVRTVEEGHDMLPRDRKYWFYDEDAFTHGCLLPKKVMHNECTWVWNSVMINCDGAVVPCCRDPQGKHIAGNVFETPLREIWNGKFLSDFRRKILKSQRDIDICRLCSGFGIPELMRSKPISFEVDRLSNDSRPLELSEEMEKEIWRQQEKP